MSSSMTLTNAKILKLRDGLKALDGIPGKSGEVVRFDFDSGTSWNITKNMVLIERAVEIYERERNKISTADGISPGTAVTDANADKIAAWKAKVDALKNDGTQDITGLLKLRRQDLQKAGRIPPGVMANLFDLIEE